MCAASLARAWLQVAAPGRAAAGFTGCLPATLTPRGLCRPPTPPPPLQADATGVPSPALPGAVPVGMITMVLYDRPPGQSAGYGARRGDGRSPVTPQLLQAYAAALSKLVPGAPARCPCLGRARGREVRQMAPLQPACPCCCHQCQQLRGAPLLPPCVPPMHHHPCCDGPALAARAQAPRSPLPSTMTTATGRAATAARAAVSAAALPRWAGARAGLTARPHSPGVQQPSLRRRLVATCARSHLSLPSLAGLPVLCHLQPRGASWRWTPSSRAAPRTSWPPRCRRCACARPRCCPPARHARRGAGAAAVRCQRHGCCRCGAQLPLRAGRASQLAHPLSARPAHPSTACSLAGCTRRRGTACAGCPAPASCRPARPAPA